MLIRAGFDIRLSAAAEVPILIALAPRPDLVKPVFGSEDVHAVPRLPIKAHRDGFGNRIGRLSLPQGELQLISDFIVQDPGVVDPVHPEARQHPISELPDDTLTFLLPSRYIESDLLADEAWNRFGTISPGWARVQAVCDFVHQHLVFGYAHGRPTKTAVNAFHEGTGVCRDFAHLSIAFCRALNIPSRYASGYLGDIGVPYGGPMDFCAWFEVWLEGRWYTFDARYNMPRIGRLVMVRGRDAADVAMITSFGAAPITHFEVWCEEVPASVTPAELRTMIRVPELNATAQLTLLRRA